MCSFTSQTTMLTLRSDEGLVQLWDAQFQEYFKKQVHPDVDTHIGQLVLERYNSYSPYSGVKNNWSESLNCVIKLGPSEAPGKKHLLTACFLHST